EVRSKIANLKDRRPDVNGGEHWFVSRHRRRAYKAVSVSLLHNGCPEPGDWYEGRPVAVVTLLGADGVRVVTEKRYRFGFLIRPTSRALETAGHNQLQD